MPAVAIPLIAAGIGAAGTAYAAHSQASNANRSASVQSQAADAALAFEKEQDRLDRERYDKEEARRISLEDQDRQIAADNRARTEQLAAERQARLAPYVNFGQQGMNTLSGLLTPSTAPRQPRIIGGPAPAPPAARPTAPLSALATPPMTPPVGSNSAASSNLPPAPPSGPMPTGFADAAKMQGIPLSALAQPIDPRDPRYRRYGASA